VRGARRAPASINAPGLLCRCVRRGSVAQELYAAGRVGTSAGGGTGHRAVKSEESRGRGGQRLRGSERRTRRDQPLPDSLANVRAIPKVRPHAPRGAVPDAGAAAGVGGGLNATADNSRSEVLNSCATAGTGGRLIATAVAQPPGSLPLSGEGRRAAG